MWERTIANNSRKKKAKKTKIMWSDSFRCSSKCTTESSRSLFSSQYHFSKSDKIKDDGQKSNKIGQFKNKVSERELLKQFLTIVRTVSINAP